MEGSDDRSGRPENTHLMAFWNKTRDEAPSPDGPEETPIRLTPSLPEEPYPMAMLKRDDVQTPSSSDLNALLGRGSEFDGKLSFEGTVRIDGKFTGQIQSGDVLVVGEGAKISAEISCGTIIVHGEVQGDVKAKNAVELHQPARMKGNIETPSLMIEKGVAFEGQCKMDGVERGSGAKPAPSPAPVTALKT
jgi:cytoskeletal protein CcmA (bactofilin family)